MELNSAAGNADDSWPNTWCPWSICNSCLTKYQKLKVGCSTLVQEAEQSEPNCIKVSKIKK